MGSSVNRERDSAVPCKNPMHPPAAPQFVIPRESPLALEPKICYFYMTSNRFLLSPQPSLPKLEPHFQEVEIQCHP